VARTPKGRHAQAEIRKSDSAVCKISLACSTLGSSAAMLSAVMIHWRGANVCARFDCFENNASHHTRRPSPQLVINSFKKNVYVGRWESIYFNIKNLMTVKCNEYESPGDTTSKHKLRKMAIVWKMMENASKWTKSLCDGGKRLRDMVIWQNHWHNRIPMQKCPKRASNTEKTARQRHLLVRWQTHSSKTETHANSEG